MTELKMDGNGRERLYILYDGTCNLCIATVRRLRELHSSADLRFVSIQSLEENKETIPGIGAIPLEQLMAKLHVVEQSGALYAGADGIVRILRTVAGFRWLALLYRIPGMRRSADAIYRFIASRRYDWFGKTEESCENGVCTLPKRDQA
jgi:predicted DCC family thiol-disulfide oxidoreductase YuxK